MSQKYNLAVISGDGIGPEIIKQALKVLDQLAKKFDLKFNYQECLAGGVAWERYQKHLPEQTLKICQRSDALLFGAVGGPVDQQHQPKWKNVEKNVLLGLRKSFDFFANLRPIKSEKCDFLIVRELTSGIYFGEHKIKIKKAACKQNQKSTLKAFRAKIKTAIDVMEYNNQDIERILEIGFQAALGRRQKLTLVDKANVLETSRLWREIAEQLRKKYHQVDLEYMFVDNAAYQLAKDPLRFDVIVTSNMFGDILSDESAVWARSLGMIPSASLGKGSFGMYEPAHGSAPKHAGQGTANPIAMILSAALLLRYSLNLVKPALAIEQSIKKVLAQGYGTADLNPDKVKTTNELGDLIAQNL